MIALTKFRISQRTFVFALVLLCGGGLLLAGGWWLRPIIEAEQAMDERSLERALERLALAERRFELIPVSKRVLPGLYDLVVTNELALMYALQQYDAVIDKAGATGAPGGRFWAGCALFAKGALEPKAEARIGWLSQSQEEFRRALEHASTQWDAKFNYELVGRLIADAWKKPDTEQEMKLVKPSPMRQPPPKVG